MSLESTKEKVPEQKEEIIENLFLFLKEKREREEKDIGENFPEVMKDLPKDLRNVVEQNFQRFKSYHLTAEQLLSELKHDVETMKIAYEDKRFGIPNGSYLRYEIKRGIDDLVANFTDEKINFTKIKGFGIISLDVNGLKTVNDVISHEVGNTYLSRIVEVLKGGSTTKELEARRISVFVSSNGGDEFSIILSDDVNLIESVGKSTFINNILKKYQEEVSRIDTSDLINFNRPEISEKFKDFSIPEGFKFMATISGGTACIEEVLVDDGFIPNATAGYSDNLNFIINGLFEISDQRSKKDKNKFKEKLENSTDPQEKFLAVLLKRNLETALIEEENKKLKLLVKTFEKK